MAASELGRIQPAPAFGRHPGIGGAMHFLKGESQEGSLHTDSLAAPRSYLLHPSFQNNSKKLSDDWVEPGGGGASAAPTSTEGVHSMGEDSQQALGRDDG